MRERERERVTGTSTIIKQDLYIDSIYFKNWLKLNGEKLEISLPKIVEAMKCQSNNQQSIGYLCESV